MLLRYVHLGRQYCAIAPQYLLGGSSIRLALSLLETIASYGTRFVVCDIRACHLSSVYAVRVGLREMLIFV